MIITEDMVGRAQRASLKVGRSEFLSRDAMLAAIKAIAPLLVAQETREIREIRGALEAMVAEKADYMIINNLGDPEEQHTIKQARAALARAQELDPK